MGKKIFFMEEAGQFFVELYDEDIFIEQGLCAGDHILVRAEGVWFITTVDSVPVRHYSGLIELNVFINAMHVTLVTDSIKRVIGEHQVANLDAVIKV